MEKELDLVEDALSRHRRRRVTNWPSIHIPGIIFGHHPVVRESKLHYLQDQWAVRTEEDDASSPERYFGYAESVSDLIVKTAEGYVHVEGTSWSRGYTIDATDSAVLIPSELLNQLDELGSRVLGQQQTILELRKKLARFMDLQPKPAIDFEALGNQVKDRYAQVAQVTGIYQRELGDTQEFVVVTSNKQYDDQLMDQLIDIEIAILDEFPVGQIDFTFVPEFAVSGNNGDLQENAQVIYQR